MAQYCYMWCDVLFASLAILAGSGNVSLQLREELHIYGGGFGLVAFNHLVFLGFAPALGVQLGTLLSAALSSWSLAGGLSPRVIGGHGAHQPGPP